MSRPIIEVEGLSKRYRLGQFNARSLREETEQFVRRLRGGGGAVRRADSADFWALQDVSFSVQPGEVVGIIGRNGAGKSTLLKILSRVTEPTSGHARLRGRVASLLEVGTGFHPELTGRENIFVNGAILGMTRAEIAAKFDEIVDFSGVQDFLDTPVKRYSSGMYVRLAFSVAAHLEPEILIVDEILAVGDAEFQRKCLGKIKGIAASVGRTVLFVSHSMASVLSLCTRGLHLDRGRLVRAGGAQEIVRQYQAELANDDLTPLVHRIDRSGDQAVKLTSVRVRPTEGDGVVRSSSRLRFSLEYESSGRLVRPTFLIGIYDELDRGIFLLRSDRADFASLPASGRVVCETDEIRLTAGRCNVNVAVSQGDVLSDYVQNATHFEVKTDDSLGAGKEPPREWVTCIVRHSWFEGVATAVSMPNDH